MAFSLHPHVAYHDFVRSRTTESAYVARLAERGELIQIGNVAVDATSLVRRRYVCDTVQCLQTEPRDGHAWYRGSCCTDLLVEITTPEQERLRPLAEQYLERFPNGDRQIVCLAKKIMDVEYLAWTSKREPVLGDHPTNRCVLSFIPRHGRLYCGVNGMAYALGLPVKDHKPDACYAYPIHYVDYEPDKWFLTVICRRNYRDMGGSKEAACMACLENPMAEAPPAYVSLRGELEHLWGKDFYREIEREAKKFLVK